MRLLYGFAFSQSLYVVTRLGIADLLRDGPRHYEELATATGAHPRSLYRVLRVLASEDLFEEVGQGRFALTPLAELLRTDHPSSLAARVLLPAEDWFWGAWGHLQYSVETGKPAVEHAYGMPVYQFLQHHPDAVRVFDRSMASRTAGQTRLLLEVFDFGDFRALVDVGAGSGTLLIAVLRAHPQLRGVLFDRAQVVAAARTQLQDAGLADRCEAVAGDFFEAVPIGGDGYVLKSILHNWDDERSREILATCRRAMSPATRLLLIERLIPPGNDPDIRKYVDLDMLVIQGGYVRSEAEHRALLEASGFRLARVVHTRSEISVIEAVPA